MPDRLDAAGAVIRLAMLVAALALAGCGSALVPLAGAGLGFGTAVVTLDTHVFDDCVAGKSTFDCTTGAGSK